MRVYFCHPKSPWHRGYNENTKGSLRQYLPSITDLSVHSPDHLNPFPANSKGGLGTPSDRSHYLGHWPK
jgi:hypothetical protein